MKRDTEVFEEVALNKDEYKLIERYREALEKLKPGQSEVTRQWSFPVDETDAIRCSVALSHYSHEPRMTESDVKIERAKMHLIPGRTVKPR